MRFLPSLLVLLLIVGCANGDDQTFDDFDDQEMTDDQETVDTTDWTASLTPNEGFEAVSASASAYVQDGQTFVSANLSGAEAGATHPWHIHEGSCESGGGIFGDANAYPAFEANEDGEASADATIDMALEAGQNYHVNVHGAPGDLGTIVACGDLHQQ